MKMLLILQIIGLSGIAMGQFYSGHPLAAGLYNSGSDDRETLPISQEELAQLMAQSLATSGKYRSPKTESAGNDDFAGNYEGGEEGAGEAPNQTDEYSNNYGTDEHQNVGEGGEEHPDEQTEGQPEGGSDEGSHYQPKEPQQTYRENSGGYENPQEGEQSGQYPDPNAQSYGSANSDSGYGHEQQPGAYDSQRTQYDDSPQSYGQQSGYQTKPNKGYRSAVSPIRSRYPHNSESSYSSDGSGYSGPGSESYAMYDIRRSPTSNRYRS